MLRLSQALQQFIEQEEIINNAPEIEKKLKNEYLRQLEYESFFDTDKAEEVFKTYQAITNHSDAVEISKERKAEAEKVIKQYLEAVQRKPIMYIHQNGQAVFPRYFFSLDEHGNVVHNNSKPK